MFNFIKNLFKKKGPSKEPKEGKNLEIVHKSCENTIYYSDDDIRYGDRELLDAEGSCIQRAYIDCPHCKEQLTFSFND